MTPIERSLVERKLGRIAERLAYLETVAAEGWERYRDGFERRKAAEKVIQELIEAALDVNSHLLVELGHGAPEPPRPPVRQHRRSPRVRCHRVRSGAVPALRGRRQADDRGCFLTASMARGTVSLGLTLYQASTILPFSSMRNDERMMPIDFRPRNDFSPHAPYASATR